MPHSDVHFEVFCRQSAKDAWVLHEVLTVREKALSAAAELIASKQAKGVKVVRETYDGETGDYTSLSIFEDGHTKLALDPAAEELPSAAPCFRPEDLYTRHARATLTRLLRGHLTRHKLTTIELIHRADCLEKLESSGTTFQHAVQKMAVAQAASSGKPVQQIIKALNDLAARAVSRVYRDSRRGHFPVVGNGAFGALADKLASAPDGIYVFNAALARHLAPCKSWDEKLATLLTVTPQAPESGPGRALLLDAIDNLIAEILGSSAALHELLGERENLGQALLVLVHLFLGILSEEEAKSEVLTHLAEHFIGDGMPNARGAVASRIIAELKNTKRLCPTSRLDELRMLRKIANTLSLGGERHLSHEALVAGFTLRSRRLIAAEAIADYLADVSTPDDKLERLLRVEEGITGGENKRHLGAVVQQIVSASAFEDHFVANSTPAIARLRRLAELQARVQRSHFPDHQREPFSTRLDQIAQEVESRGRVLKTLQDSNAGPAARALAILKLCANNVLTEGLAGKARELVLANLAQPEFLAGYIAQAKTDTEALTPERAMADLLAMLQHAGISREGALRSMRAA
ncbi:MAG TPA: hypothetical protein VKB71_19555 [Rhizomicrobium sp.]|nr:hypothetical protein [Rhizomicrobium sp.]